jgi:hypothetical protein
LSNVFLDTGHPIPDFRAAPGANSAMARHHDYALFFVAPPKRKSGSGRVTPKGTKPGTLPTAGTPTARHKAPKRDSEHEYRAAEASSRYTPKVPQSQKESPRWWPALMISLFAVGGVLILIKYLGWVPGGQDGSQWWIVGGLVSVLGGLFTATQWR